MGTVQKSCRNKVYKTDGTCIECDNPTNMPDVSEIDYMEEPMVRATIMLPKDYVGNIMELCQDRRGSFIGMDYNVFCL